ncbi:MAG: ribonuclease P protein component 1 [Candidatus Micrarchaeia archaeon]
MWEYNNKNIVLHELAGLHVKILNSPDKFRKGVQGIVIDETKNLLIIRTEDKGIQKVPKDKSTFLLKPEGFKKGFVVRGEEIMFRSYERTEKAFKYYKRR